MKILPKIDSPSDLKMLSPGELQPLAREIREFLVDVVPSVGGHFASSLGVVELTIALHYVLNTPEDLLVWDVGHQAYVHKMLTGRRDALHHLRQYGGISGFLKRNESVFDCFGAGHASTSISAALGFATARDLKQEKHRVVAIIGDGSLTGGMAYEGLNNAGQAARDLLVILNDNNMSISPNVGAISYYLNAIITNPFYQKIKNDIWELTAKFPPFTQKIRKLARRAQDSLKSFILPGMFFEDLGFKYFGPVNGHDLEELLQILGRIKDLKGPVLLHVLTKKGKGFTEAERNPEKYHGIKPASTGGRKEGPVLLSYTDIFGKSIADLAEKNRRVCAITAAMSDGTGLNEFRDRFPDRFFDVGIAEEHAVTFSSSLAADGLRPVVAVYSSFLQRSFDQIIHDVALQKFPVVFAVDRAGIVGEDGPTHHGNFDISFLNVIPELVVAAPKDGQELRNLLYTALRQDESPFAIRYPRGQSPEPVDFEAAFEEIPVGQWEILQEGENILILAVGTMVAGGLAAAGLLRKQGVSSTVVNCRFIKPLDEQMLHSLLASHSQVVTLEENSLEGGFGSKVAAFIQKHGFASTVDLKMGGLPDRFIEHGKRDLLLDMAGLSARRIAEWIVAGNAHTIPWQPQDSGLDTISK